MQSRQIVVRLQRRRYLHAISYAPGRQDQRLRAKIRPHAGHGFRNPAGAIQFQTHQIPPTVRIRAR